MDRRYFLISGGAATAAAASAGLVQFSPAAIPGEEAATARANAKAAVPVAPVQTQILASRATDTQFQLAFVPHAYQRGTLARYDVDAPLRVVFYGFGFRNKTSTLDSLIVDAGYVAPDTSTHRHMLWASSKRGTGNPVRLTVTRANFAGFLAQTVSNGAKVSGIEVYSPGGDVAWEYGSYVLASRSTLTGRFPDWSQLTYSGNPAQPLASASAPIDFDYLTFEVMRDDA